MVGPLWLRHYTCSHGTVDVARGREALCPNGGTPLSLPPNSKLEVATVTQFNSFFNLFLLAFEWLWLCSVSGIHRSSQPAANRSGPYMTREAGERFHVQPLSPGAAFSLHEPRLGVERLSPLGIRT